ncbi:DUF721 domain-containing protein [Chitinivibrio alkaliphilus]|uniref:DUF721 domain-containing protein n=1 Tax=Chitinivibrio alkaliphilus ACht1 TaxID=1313304 RepID=U7DA08_9BACT|nr:hypothetical protein CALK_1150 [Chitinivibrio alkaliphilus ACht1]
MNYTPKPRPPLYKIGDILDDVLTSMRKNNKNRNVYDLAYLQREWSSIVGSNISHVSTPVFLKGNILTVEVTNSTWKMELFFMKKIY